MRKPEKIGLKSRIEEAAMAAGVLALAGGLLAVFLAVSAWLFGAWGPRGTVAPPVSVERALK